ncbi:MAG: tetratricopeptide repeat protein, partial [Sandaracinaceae bacterium]|nr:tetratricopeptide repeat protein [Sandaracinaceae bacterium]
MSDKSKTRRDSTLEVGLSEVTAAPAPEPDSELGRVLDQLEEEVDATPAPPRPRTVPPPLPVKRASSASPPPRTDRTPSAIPPPRPSAIPARGDRTPSAIPPPLRPRAPGLGRPPSLPPPSPQTRTAPGILAPAAAAGDDDAYALAQRDLERAKDSARKGRLLVELGRLAECDLQDSMRAETHYLAALELLPESVPALRGARRALIRNGKARAALPLFDTEVRLTADPPRKAALLLAKGRLLEDSLGDRAGARAAFAGAAELDRSDRSALRALAACDEDAADPARLDPTLEREANAVADPRLRAARIARRARLAESSERVDQAIELYEIALRLDPSAYSALAALERLHYAQHRWRDLIRVLAAQAEELEDRAQRALIFYRIARLHTDRLGSRDDAIAALERAAAESPDDALVLGTLAELYAEADRPEARLAVLQRLLPSTTRPADRVALLHRIGELALSLERADEARAAHAEAHALDPTDVPTLQALGALLEQAEAWDALVTMHLGEAEAAREPERKAAALARVAEILERHRGDAEEAIDQHARAIALAPRFEPSFKALMRLYPSKGRWHELVRLLERAVELASDDSVAIAHLMRIGAVYEDHLGEPAQAAHAYRRVLERDGKSLVALHALQRACERAERYAELAGALDREAELHEEGRRVAGLLLRAAEVLAERLGDRDGAIARLRRVLELDRGSAAAFAGLARVYRAAGRWEDLLELYRGELTRDPHGPGAANLWYEMGRIGEERIGRADEATTCYRRALEVSPEHGPAGTALLARLEAARDFEGLAKALEAAQRVAREPQTRARHAMRLGEVLEDGLGKPDRALAAYESALTALPGCRPAADAVRRLRTAQGNFRRVAEEIEREAAASRPPRSASLFAEAARTWWDSLGDPKRAAELYERALEEVPGHLPSLLALETLARRLERSDLSMRVAAALARNIADLGARVAALRDLARLQERAGDEPAQVRQTYELILSLVPDDALALAALERLALEGGDRALLAKVDAALGARAGDPRVASFYQTRLAESLEAAGDSACLGAFRAALSSDPENVAAARGLGRAARARGDFAALVEALEREAAAAMDDAAGARHLIEAARVTRAELRDSKRALALFEEALERWPDDPDASAGVRDLALAAGQATRAADRLARASTSARTAERMAELGMEVAVLQADLLDNIPAAIASLGRVLAQAPRHVPAMRRLAELHLREGRYAEAAELFGRVVELAPDHVTLEAAHLALAAIWQEHLKDPKRALVSLQALLSLRSDHPEALRRLARLSASTGDLDKAARTLAALVERDAPPEERAADLVLLASLEGRRGNVEAERRALLQALALEGPDGEAARAHRALVAGSADWKAHAEALGAWLRRPDRDTGEVRRGTLEIARILTDELARPLAAAEGLERLARARPEDLDVRRALAEAWRLGGKHDAAAGELRSLLETNVARP